MRHFLLINNTAIIIIVKIDLIAVITITVAIITIIIKTIKISKTYALFTRNQIAVPKSIYKKNKTLKRHNLRLETLINLVIKYATPVTLISTL